MVRTAAAVCLRIVDMAVQSEGEIRDVTGVACHASQLGHRDDRFLSRDSADAGDAT